MTRIDNCPTCRERPDCVACEPLREGDRMGWVERACWVALVIISVVTAAKIGCPVGWLVG